MEEYREIIIKVKSKVGKVYIYKRLVPINKIRGVERISKSGRHYLNYYVRKTVKNRPANYNRNIKECLERDNYTCQICGAKESLVAHHRDNNGHHIAGYETDDSLGNLLTLCQSCHIKMHYGTTERNAEISKRRFRGERLESIAKTYGLSRQRVFRIVKRDIDQSK